MDDLTRRRMDDLTRRRKEEDLIYQNIEEKALLQRQAIAEEKAQLLYLKIEQSAIPKDIVFAMLADEKPLAEIMAFLDHEIVELGVKQLMAGLASIGKPIAEENARNRVKALMESAD
jgi:hypothetical protein